MQGIGVLHEDSISKVEAMSVVREPPFTSFFARKPTRSPLASTTESSLKDTLAPIPRNRLLLTSVTEPLAIVPA